MTWKRIGTERSRSADGAEPGAAIPLDRPKPERRPMSWASMTLMMTTLGLAALVAYALVRFGSIRAGIGHLRGDCLVPDSYTKSFGAVSQGAEPTVTFALGNVSGAPITILGARCSCSCNLPPSLPIQVLPSETIYFKTRVLTKRQRGGVAETIRLYAYVTRPGNPPSSPDVREIPLNVEGIVNVGAENKSK